MSKAKVIADGFPAWPATSRVCNLGDFGLVGDYLTNGAFTPNPTDNYAAWNEVMSHATPGDTFIIPNGPNGQCFMGTSGAIVLPNDCKLRGWGRGVGGIVRMNNPGLGNDPAFIDIGLRTTVEDLRVWCGPGQEGGIALKRHATSANDAAQVNVIRNVFITGFGDFGPDSGAWYAGISIDSTLGAPNYGSRSCAIQGAHVHRYRTFGIKLAGQNAGTFSDLDLEASIPDFAGWDLYLTGSASQQTNICNISGGSLDRVLLQYTNACHFSAGSLGLVSIDATCTSNKFDAGFISLTPTMNGANNFIRAGKQTFQSSS